jgi:hypothetical protein
MIPINDRANRYSFFPFITVSLITACCLYIFSGPRLTETTGLLHEIRRPEIDPAGKAAACSNVTAFPARRASHLAGNMLAPAFGRRRMPATGASAHSGGHSRIILFTLVSVTCSSPIGASGAICVGLISAVPGPHTHLLLLGLRRSGCASKATGCHFVGTDHSHGGYPVAQGDYSVNHYAP